MRVLMLSLEYPPLGGGGARVVDGLSRELARQGHEVDVLTMGFRGLPRNERVDGVTVHRVPCLRRRLSMSEPFEHASYVAAAIPHARSLARRRGYDINHTHFILPDGIIANAVKRLTGLPYVLTAHGSDVPGYNPDRFHVWHRLLGPVWRTVVKGAAQVVSPSAALERLVLTRSPDTILARVVNGAHLTRYDPDRPRRDRILIVTRVFERKGVQHLLEALRDTRIGFEVDIVGDGPYLTALERQAVEVGRPVRFHGWLENPSPELRDLYETSSIFVFPSEAENFPIVLLEAMAAGLAIVTTRGTGCEEVVGDAALLVEPRDPEGLRHALRRLVQDRELRERLGRAARKRVERFSWTNVAAQYVELYERHRAQPSATPSPAALSTSADGALRARVGEPRSP